MPIIKVADEKTGPNTVVNVDVGLNDALVFPPICPCCVEPSEPGAVIIAECKHLPAIVFPACEKCRRHLRIEDSISSVLSPIMLAVSVLSVFGTLFYRGATATAGAGAGQGWQVLGGLLNMQFPFMGPINFAICVAGGGAVFLAMLFVYWVFMTVLLKFFTKASCGWIRGAVRLSRWYYSGEHCRRLTFDNPAYAARFVEANSRAPL
jgi:hypothetical protein